LAILSLILIGTLGLNLGVDFKGGSIIEVRSKSGPVDIAKLRDVANNAKVGSIQVQGLREPTDALLRMETQPGGDAAQDVATSKLIKELGDGYEIRNKEVIGGAVSKELLSAGIWAVIASLVGILLYVWFRFEWQFALAAILALVHDVFITCGMFALLRYEFDLTVVAALLTLAGYSVNDTVVVFDRIRENMRKYKKMPLWDLLDLSINETLSRTVLTAGTVFLAVLALYIFGTEVIHGFAFAMLFGVLIGTWSSIFVAAPLLMFFGLTREKVTGQKDDAPKAPKGGAAKQGAKA
jgi:preprotein translocase subunit SecF